MRNESQYVYGDQIGLPMLIHLSRLRSQVAHPVPWHSHPGCEIIFILEGATAYEFSGKSETLLSGGKFLVVPAGFVHRGKHDMRAPCKVCGLAINDSPGTSWKGTTFNKSDRRQFLNTFHSPTPQVHPFNPALRWLVRRLMEETVNHYSNPHQSDSAAALRSLICTVLVEVMRQVQVPPSEPREFVAAAIAYLKSRLADNVRMNELARQVGYSRARMFDLFKAQTGLTPNDYLQRLRIEKAQELLKQSETSVTDIALTLGFSSGQYFSTVFGRYMGVSPKEFRQGAKPGKRHIFERIHGELA